MTGWAIFEIGQFPPSERGTHRSFDFDPPLRSELSGAFNQRDPGNLKSGSNGVVGVFTRIKQDCSVAVAATATK